MVVSSKEGTAHGGIYKARSLRSQESGKRGGIRVAPGLASPLTARRSRHTHAAATTTIYNLLDLSAFHAWQEMPADGETT